MPKKAADIARASAEDLIAQAMEKAEDDTVIDAAGEMYDDAEDRTDVAAAAVLQT